MFAERFDALMNIAEVSNSQLGRSVSLNSSHIGRLRSGARALPKKHDYLSAMCRYLADRITKDYQITALQRLTGIDSGTLADPEDTALYLEHWLTGQIGRNASPSEMAGRFISGFSHHTPQTQLASSGNAMEDPPQKYAEYLFGNAGKRKAVEQFFTAVLQEDKPQTLLLFSDEDMAWLYEDTAFAAKWAELFALVIQKGNHVRIIHTVSRDLNEMIEALMKWIPLYMTGMIEPHCYPRLRDGVYRRTLFVAPQTAAIISSSVQQNTDRMLNLFLTNQAALDALTAEFEHYFTLCRPLMHIYPEQDADAFRKVLESLVATQGNAYLCCAMPPLFAMPEALVKELEDQSGGEKLYTKWKRSLFLFERSIKRHGLTIIILNPRHVLASQNSQRSSSGKLFACGNITYSAQQYATHKDQLAKMESIYSNLEVRIVDSLESSAILYMKEDAGVIVARANTPRTAFVITDRNMMNAFLDYLETLMQ